MSSKNMPDAVAFATEDQIGHILEMWKKRLKMRKLTRDEGQVIITNGGLYLPVMDQATDVLVDRVRMNMSNTIVRMIKVNRGRSPQEALDATNRTQYTDKKVVATIPRGEGDEVEMTFFRLGVYATNEEVAAEYEARSSKPDPYAQMAINQADSAFADEYPNGTQWPNGQGGYNYLSFFRWSGGRDVGCGHDVDDWFGDWWFGGVRK